MKFAQLRAEEIETLNHLKFKEKEGLVFKLTENEIELIILIFKIRTRNDLIELRNAVVRFTLDLMEFSREQEDYEECDRLNRVQTVMTHIIDEEIRDRKLQEI